METHEIKQAVLKFMPQLEAFKTQASNADDVRRLMGLFLEQVLGYDPEEELVFQSIQPDHAQLPTQFDDNIKFLLQPLAAQADLDQTLIDQAVGCALAIRAQLLALTNGTEFILYDIDTSSGKLEVEAVFELNLLTDAVDHIAVNLWIIGKKDCGKMVVLNTA